MTDMHAQTDLSTYSDPALIDHPLSAVHSALVAVRLLAMDVDGVLTDGCLGYGSDGAEEKRFHVHDGMGMTLVKRLGVQIAWISGRSNPGVERRAGELGVTLLEGVKDKERALRQLEHSLNLTSSQIAYIGDDWNDLGAFAASGVRIAVADARPEVRERADLITRSAGGRGAVREVCDALLDAQTTRLRALEDYLESLRAGVAPAGQ